jgi:hypothetical protein
MHGNVWEWVLDQYAAPAELALEGLWTSTILAFAWAVASAASILSRSICLCVLNRFLLVYFGTILFLLLS